MENWVKKRLALLIDKLDHKPFLFVDAEEVLKEAFGDDTATVKKVLSELQREGVLEVRAVEADKRKKVYRILVKENISELVTRGELDTLLKTASNLIRNRVDYTFLLVLLFYKAISDKWRFQYEETLRKLIEEQGIPREFAEELAQSEIYQAFTIPEGYLWQDIMNKPDPVGELLIALKKIAEANPELSGAIDRKEFEDFLQNSDNRSVIIAVMNKFNDIDFSQFPTDLLGDAYEFILRNFAPEKAKQGEVYTPREVINLMVDILQPRPGETVYDPACGSGGMLIAVDRYLKQHYSDEEREKTELYGQEVNPVTAALARMNLLIHGIDKSRVFIEVGDTLLNPKFREGDTIKKFDVVIANPPWNLKNTSDKALKNSPLADERFKYGYTTKSSADWAWIQHMLASSTGKNKIAVVFDTGLLFRGNKEKAIRKAVLEEDFIETVILLPEKLFYNTSAPGVIIILNKNKAEDRKGKVLFINASELYAPHPTVRKLNTITPEQRAKIAEHAIEWKEEPHFAKIVDIEEIRKNDYNLSVQRYVFPKIEVEEIDIASEWKKIGELTEKENELRQKIEGYLREIGIELKGGE